MREDVWYRMMMISNRVILRYLTLPLDAARLDCIKIYLVGKTWKTCIWVVQGNCVKTCLTCLTDVTMNGMSIWVMIWLWAQGNLTGKTSFGSRKTWKGKPFYLCWTWHIEASDLFDNYFVGYLLFLWRSKQDKMSNMAFHEISIGLTNILSMWGWWTSNVPSMRVQLLCKFPSCHCRERSHAPLLYVLNQVLCMPVRTLYSP